jgi:hypothetical protein
MKKFRWSSLIFAIALSAVPVTVRAGVPQTAGQDIKNAGTDTKDATKSAGKGIGKGTKTGYNKTKSGTKKVYHKTASGTKKAVHKTGEGVSKTGDKIAGKPSPQ